MSAAPGRAPRSTGVARVVGTIMGANLIRLSRDRLGLFFIVVLPFLIILIFGVAASGPGTTSVGLVDEGDGPLATRLTERIAADEAVEVVHYVGRDALEVAVRRRRAQAGIVIPAEYDDALRAGTAVALPLLADPAGGVPEVARAVIGRAVADESATVEAARHAAAATGTSFAEAFAFAAAVDRAAEPAVAVQTVVADAAIAGYSPLGQSAAGNLVLFIFITSLVGSSALVESRRLGMSRRMLAAPTRSGVLLLGEAAGRFATALGQGVLVVVGAALLFGVDWVDPLAVMVIVALFSLVGTGAAMLMGARFNNAEQASGVGVPLGIGLGMLGGCMWPLEIVPPAMQAVGRLTPHAWAMDALSGITMRGEGFADVLVPVGVLVVYAGGLLAVASLQLRRSLRA